MSALCLFTGFFFALVKACDTTAGLGLLLLTRIERMALGTNVHFDYVAFLRRACYERCPASTFYGNFVIIGMYTFFHNEPRFVIT